MNHNRVIAHLLLCECPERPRCRPHQDDGVHQWLRLCDLPHGHGEPQEGRPDRPVLAPGEVRSEGIGATHFGDAYNLRTNSPLILVAEQGPAGMQPRHFHLPHQLYVHRVREMMQGTVTGVRVLGVPAAQEPQWLDIELPEGA